MNRCGDNCCFHVGATVLLAMKENKIVCALEFVEGVLVVCPAFDSLTFALGASYHSKQALSYFPTGRVRETPIRAQVGGIKPSFER